MCHFVASAAFLKILYVFLFIDKKTEILKAMVELRVLSIRRDYSFFSRKIYSYRGDQSYSSDCLCSAIARLSVRRKWISHAIECQKCRIEQRMIASVYPTIIPCEIWKIMTMDNVASENREYIVSPDAFRLAYRI